MNAIPIPIAISGSINVQGAGFAVIAYDSHNSATARVEKPNPMIGRG